MIGPLKTGKYGFTHILVAVDKFTKWIEAKPIKSLDAATAVNFVQVIIHRFGVRHYIITDNGTNFDFAIFKDFCWSQGIKVNYTSVAHPQSNGQVERANGLILKGIKPCLIRELKEAAGAWVDELPSIYGGCELHPIVLLSFLLSSWYMEQKLSFQVT